MEGSHSGYQLRSAMQVPLGRDLKIRYGFVYPLLLKLAKAGLIELTSKPIDASLLGPQPPLPGCADQVCFSVVYT